MRENAHLPEGMRRQCKAHRVPQRSVQRNNVIRGERKWMNLALGVRLRHAKWAKGRISAACGDRKEVYRQQQTEGKSCIKSSTGKKSAKSQGGMSICSRVCLCIAGMSICGVEDVVLCGAVKRKPCTNDIPRYKWTYLATNRQTSDIPLN